MNSVVLNNPVEVVRIRFNFANEVGMPSGLATEAHETLGAYKKRKDVSWTGVEIIEPTQNCSVINVMDDLLGAGYVLVNAYLQSRRKEDPRGILPWIFYNTAYFILASRGPHPRELVSQIQPAFHLQQAPDAFRQLGEEAMWRVTVYLNPLYIRGKEFPGRYELMIKPVHRTPLYLPNGDPVVEWQKGAPRDERGKRIGSPLPLRPAFDLRVVDGAVQLVPVQ